MDVQEQMETQYKGWYNSAEDNNKNNNNDNNNNGNGTDSEVTLPMFRLQMNSLSYRQRISPTGNIDYTGSNNSSGSSKVLLDLDSHNLASADDDLPLNLTVPNTRPSVIHYPAEPKSDQKEQPSDVDEHFRRSLKGYCKRRRCSEQIRRGVSLLSPPPPPTPVATPHGRLTPQYATPSQRAAALTEAPPPYSPNWTTSSVYPTFSRTSVSPNASVSMVISAYKKRQMHGRRRASCIPFDASRKQSRPSVSPQPIRSCVVSLSESAAVSVSGSVDDHFAKSLGNATWTELKFTPTPTPATGLTPSTTPTTSPTSPTNVPGFSSSPSLRNNSQEEQTKVRQAAITMCSMSRPCDFASPLTPESHSPLQSPINVEVARSPRQTTPTSSKTTPTSAPHQPWLDDHKPGSQSLSRLPPYPGNSTRISPRISPTSSPLPSKSDLRTEVSTSNRDQSKSPTGSTDQSRNNPPAYIPLMDQSVVTDMETDDSPAPMTSDQRTPTAPSGGGSIGTLSLGTSKCITSSAHDQVEPMDAVDEHFRKALGCQTWNLLTTKS